VCEGGWEREGRGETIGEWGKSARGRNCRKTPLKKLKKDALKEIEERPPFCRRLKTHLYVQGRWGRRGGVIGASLPPSLAFSHWLSRVFSLALSLSLSLSLSERD